MLLCVVPEELECPPMRAADSLLCRADTILACTVCVFVSARACDSSCACSKSQARASACTRARARMFAHTLRVRVR
eukprot:4335889-Pleurochrysis_carterae.AAC.4